MSASHSIQVPDNYKPLNDASAEAKPISRTSILKIALGAVFLSGGMLAASYFGIRALDSHSNNDQPSPPQPDCAGNLNGNMTCPFLPLTTPETIIVNGTAVNSHWTLRDECCSPNAMIGDICCDSPISNYTYWMFEKDNFLGFSSNVTCAIGNVLAGSITQAVQRAMAFFQSPTIAGFTGVGVSCFEDVKPTEEQWCSYSSMDHSEFPQNDPNYLTGYENIRLACYPSSQFGSGSSALFSAKSQKARELQQQSQEVDTTLALAARRV